MLSQGIWLLICLIWKLRCLKWVITKAVIFVRCLESYYFHILELSVVSDIFNSEEVQMSKCAFEWADNQACGCGQSQNLQLTKWKVYRDVTISRGMVTILEEAMRAADVAKVNISLPSVLEVVVQCVRELVNSRLHVKFWAVCYFSPSYKD